MAETKTCPKCKSVLPNNAPSGICPKCLMLAGIESEPNLHSASEMNPTTDAPRFVPPNPKDIAKFFPQLEILELLGQGGMGAVYKARQPGLDRFVAVKILPPEVGHDVAFVDRFTREAKALARLTHPNIVAVHDVGQTNGLFYFVMEYIDGANLRQAIQAKSLTPEEALAIVPQICDALQFAHDEGIVHRDIKPENVLIDRKGRVKIADFGLAKLLGDEQINGTLTHTNQVMGTLRYMAPEQLQDTHDVDHRADIYSLGVVFYELLTGTVPMGRFDPPSQKVQIDVRLDEVVLRALAQEPDRRYQHASEVRTDIEHLVSEPVDRDPSYFRSPNKQQTQSTKKSPATGKPIEDFRLETARRELNLPATGLIAVGLLTLFTATVPLFLAIKTSHDIYDGRIKLIAEDNTSSVEPGEAAPIALESNGTSRSTNKQVPVAPAFDRSETGLVSRTLHGMGKSRHIILFMLAVIIPSIGIMIAGGGWMMKHLQSRGLALTASILAVIPCQPVFILGPIFGIWSLRILNRSHIVDAFEIAKDLPPVPLPEEPEENTGQQDYIGIGIAFGTSLGAAFGVVFQNIGVGIAVGAAIGVVMGVVLSGAKTTDQGSVQANEAKPPTHAFKTFVQARLKVPAIGLMIAGALNLVAVLIVLAAPVFVHHSDGFDEGPGFVEGSATFAEAVFVSIIVALCSLATSIAMLLGAARMMDLQSYPLAMFGAFAAIAPIAVGFPLSLPCGIWALLVLSRQDVKAAFAAGQR